MNHYSFCTAVLMQSFESRRTAYLNMFNIPVPNLDFLCIQQSNAAITGKNYANLYFDAKHLVKGLNRGW